MGRRRARRLLMPPKQHALQLSQRARHQQRPSRIAKRSGTRARRTASTWARRAFLLSIARPMVRRSKRAPSARSIFLYACAWPRQSLWQLPTPAARNMCAAVVYTRSRSCSLLTRFVDKKIRPPSCSLPESLACRALGRFERGRVGLLVQGLLPRQAGDGPPKAAKV